MLLLQKKNKMAWFDKYLQVYNKPYDEVPKELIAQTHSRIKALQSDEPEVSVVIIAYNEERRLAACISSLSELQTNYRIEILGIDNNSSDRTAQVYKELGVKCFTEHRQSPGFARQCGLVNARGLYHFFIDADTLYPPLYVDTMMNCLKTPGVACVGTFWSFYPDANHSRMALWAFELIRDTFLYLQHFKRPELCIRGMTFAFRADFARQVTIRTDILRGEDGSLALSLKKFGKIAFVYSKKCRAVTGYGTLSSEPLLKSLWKRIKIQGRGLGRIFYSKEHYEDSEENLVKYKNTKK